MMKRLLTTLTALTVALTVYLVPGQASAARLDCDSGNHVCEDQNEGPCDNWGIASFDCKAYGSTCVAIQCGGSDDDGCLENQDQYLCGTF